MIPIQIQLYQQVNDATGSTTFLDETIQIIKGTHPQSSNIEQRIILVRKYKAAVEALEKNLADDPEEKTGTWKKFLKERKATYEEYKQGLPAATWSGIFCEATTISKAEHRNDFLKGKITWPEIHKQKKCKVRTRAAEQMTVHSGFICIDIDKLTKAQLKKIGGYMRADQYCFLCFVSPSGNGLKILFRVAPDQDQHLLYFNAIELYFLNTYSIEIDTSGKDVSRLCFLSHCSNLHHNTAAVVFPLPEIINHIPEAEQKQLSKISPAEKQTLQTTGQAINDIFDNTQQVIDFTSGNRNNFFYKFACNCNRVGIPQMECISFCESAAPDKSATEIKNTVESAYKRNANEYAKYQRKDKATKPATTGTNKQLPAGRKQDEREPAEGVKPDFIFWKEQKFTKGKGDAAYTVTNYKLNRVDFCDYLFAMGFHLLHTGDSEGFQIVHSGNGIIQPQTAQQVKHYVLNWCRKYGLKEVEGMLRDGQTKYFAKNELDSLPYKLVPIKRDTAEESFFYFNNTCVVIDNQGNITPKPYSELDSFIWASSKIDFEYKKTDFTLLDDNLLLLPYDQINCEFAKFIALCSYNPHNDDEKNFSPKQITERFFSFVSAIGYMLDGYKHPSKRKGIFAIDHKVSERGEAHGRTGKSMIPQACKKLKRVVTVSGKTYDPKYQFADEMITVDTQIINYNDMPRNFDVEAIFEKIADPYSVNRRNQGFIHFEYDNSAKVYYNTNFIPKGEGESYKARMHVIEFSDYFSSTHTPYDEFGHGFFDKSWSDEEYQRFYSFMLYCVAYYKMEGVGLVDYPLPNMEARKLVNDVVPEFIDFMEDTAFVPKNQRLKKIEVMTDFNDKVYLPAYNKKLTAHTFTGWLRKFCTTKGYNLNPKQKGKHDKSNSVEYITIGDVNFIDEQTKML